MTTIIKILFHKNACLQVVQLFKVELAAQICCR